MKRFWCLLLTGLLLISHTVTVFAGEALPAQTPEKETLLSFMESRIEGWESPSLQLRKRLMALMEEYPHGSFFTDDGLACTHHFDCYGPGDCNCKTVTAEEAGTAGNMQCFGFARMAFYRLFGLSFPHFNFKDYLHPKQEKESEHVSCLWTVYPQPDSSAQSVIKGFVQTATVPPVTEEQARQYLEEICLGDVIQTGQAHTMIAVGKDEKGITVYDANLDLSTCMVQVHHLSWQKLTGFMNRYGVSVYRSVSYPVPDQEPRLECIEKPKYFAVGKIPAGLRFLYTQGDYACLLVWGEKGEIYADDGVNPVTEHKDAWQNSLSLQAGEGGEKGVLRFSYRGAFWESREEVFPIPEGVLQFQPPLKTEYRRGEAFSFEGVRMELLLPDEGRYLCSPEEIGFSGFDSSAEGECKVTAKAYGFEKSFSVRILPEESTSPQSQSTCASPSSEKKTGEGKARIPFALIGGLLLGALLVLLVFLLKRRSNRLKPS